MENEYPYKQCEVCRTIADCPHPSIADDMMGTPIPPPECPKPMDVIKATANLRKKWRNLRLLYGESTKN